MLNLRKLPFSNFSYGATAAIITSMALIIGLGRSSNPKLSIISALLVVALADNIADSLSIHIYQESIRSDKRLIRSSTINNFFTRLLIVIGFILLVFFLPINMAIILSIVLGLVLLMVMSYIIARKQGVNPYSAIFYHLIIAIIVIIASHFLGEWINHFFKAHSI